MEGAHVECVPVWILYCTCVYGPRELGWKVRALGFRPIHAPESRITSDF